MALIGIWYMRASWKTHDIGMFTWVLEDGRQGFGNDCSVSRLAHTCCCNGGWLFPPPLYDCKWLCSIPWRGELAPSHRHRNEVLLLLPISLPTFFPSNSFSPLWVPGDLSAWMASSTTAPWFRVPGIFSSSLAQGSLPPRLLCRNAPELWLCSWTGIRNGQEGLQI